MSFLRTMFAVVCTLFFANVATAYSFREDPAFSYLFDKSVGNLQYTNVTGAKLYEMFVDETYMSIYDVREVDEYVAGHIPGAINIPLSQLDDRYKEISSCRTAFIHCQGGVRSIKAITKLESLGYGNLINVEDGINGWITAGGPLVKGDEPNKAKDMKSIVADIFSSLGVTMV